MSERRGHPGGAAVFVLLVTLLVAFRSCGR